MTNPQQAFIESLLRTSVNPELNPVFGRRPAPAPTLQPVGPMRQFLDQPVRETVSDPDFFKALAAGVGGLPADLANLTLPGMAVKASQGAPPGGIPGGSDQLADLLGADPNSPSTLAGLIGAPDPRDILRLAGSSNLAAALFHGTPTSRFERVPRGEKTDNIRDIFDPQFIGDPTKGEGATAFGHGFYFAENPGVARNYQRNLSYWGKPVGITENQFAAIPDDIRTLINAKANGGIISWNLIDSEVAKRGDDAIDAVAALRRHSDEITLEPGGHLFDVEIPDDVTSRMLDWDAPLSEQDLPQGVKNLIDDVRADPNGTGEDLYRQLSRELGDDVRASEELAAEGIPGIRFLDQNSRSAGEGTRNIVLFDPDTITQVKRDGELIFE